VRRTANVDTLSSCAVFVCYLLFAMLIHGKGSLPYVPGEGARQWDFTVQKSAVCPLPCASTENARQSLCRAPETHGKAFAVRPRRTAKTVFPVVIDIIMTYTISKCIAKVIHLEKTKCPIIKNGGSIN
jgi:hypothetical protein